MTERAMPEEGFLRRWARRKTEVREGREPAPAPLAEATQDDAVALPVPQPLRTAPEPDAPRPPPTLEDVAALDADADFSAFVARGVDQAVRRSALKKLFADPHFNVMDGLDVYIDDYTKPSPMSEAMLASLEHVRSVFMKMIGDEPEDAKAEQDVEPHAAPQQPPEQETQ